MKLSKQIAKTQLARISLVVGVAMALGLAVGSSRPKKAEDEIMPLLGLKSGEMVTIDQVSKSEMAMTMNGQDYMIDYTVFSNRSKQFKLMVQTENGELVEQDAPTATTIRGVLRGVEGSKVIGCMTEDGCCARIKFPSGEECYIEPIDNPAFAGVHVVYSEDDVIASARQCGTVTNLVEAKVQAKVQAKQAVEQNVATASTAPIGDLEVCEIGLDADFEYFSIFGSTTATLARMELIVNIVNDQYESEVGIRHAISEVIVRTTSNDPYTRSESTELLDQFRNFYTSGSGFGTLLGDLRLLFTGRNLNGNTVGIAFTGTVCVRRFAFALSQHVTPLSDMTDLVAHELGHSWSQRHCNCRNHTMNASLTGANDFNDTLTVPNLISYRNTRTCLDSIGPSGFGSNGLSNNDDRINGIPVADPDFSVTGSNFNATTESQEQNLVGVGSSVWWSVDSDSNGTMTINTFGSDFDTRLHVYQFVPGGGFIDLILVDDNDDANGLLQSQVSFDVTAGTRYEIRVGGSRSAESISVGSQGNIVLNGTFSEARLGDFNFDGDVDGGDVDFYIGNLDRPATGDFAQLDLNGDGAVTIADHNLHVTTLVETSNGVNGALLGDINLDGEVTVLSDALTLVTNLGQSVASRSQGDLDANGLVNVLSDAFILVGQLGQSN